MPGRQEQLKTSSRIRVGLFCAFCSFASITIPPIDIGSAHAECQREWHALSPPSEYRSIPYAVFEFDDGAGPALYFGGYIVKQSEPSNGTVILRYDGSTWSQVGGNFRYLSSAGIINCFGQFNGELIAAGYFTTVAGESINSIACLRNGTWQPLGSGISNGQSYPTVTTVCEYHGKLIAGGNFLTAGGQSANHIAAWDGAKWAPLGSGVSITGIGRFVFAILEHENKILVGGDFSSAGGVGGTSRIALWNGDEWSASMSFGASGTVRTFCKHQGQLLAGGFFAIGATGVLYWNGTQWTPFGGLGSFTINSLVSLNGGLFASGNYITCPGGNPIQTAYRVSYRVGDTWAPIGADITVFGCQIGIADAIPYRNSLVTVGDFGVGQPFPGSGIATYDPIDPVPSIIDHPVPQSLILGNSLSAEVVAEEAMTYQWRRDGVPIADDGRVSGATTAHLTITDTDLPDAGMYDVLAANGCGQVASESVAVSIACGTGRPDGDLNGDGGTDGLDIPLFTTAVLSSSQFGREVCVADFNYDRIMTGEDVPGFVAAILAD